MSIDTNYYVTIMENTTGTLVTKKCNACDLATAFSYGGLIQFPCGAVGYILKVSLCMDEPER